MGIEAVFERTAVALEKNNELLEKLIAGREDALAQLSAAAAPGTSAGGTRSRAKKAEPSEPAATAVVENAAPVATTVARTVDASNEALKARVAGWLGTDPAQQQQRAPSIKDMLNHFGSPTIAGEKSTLTDEQRYQATFFVERFVAGLPVDFSADYDFDADPLTQGIGSGSGGASDVDDMLC